jgi:hypothetical protein
MLSPYARHQSRAASKSLPRLNNRPEQLRVLQLLAYTPLCVPESLDVNLTFFRMQRCNAIIPPRMNSRMNPTLTLTPR